MPFATTVLEKVVVEWLVVVVERLEELVQWGYSVASIADLEMNRCQQ